MKDAPQLTNLQQQQALCLWKAQCRDLVDVSLTSEAISIPNHGLEFISRLLVFCTEFLQSAEPRRPFLKSHKQSSLSVYAKLVFNNTSDVQLPVGRRLLNLHHQDFISEFNCYETQSETPSPEFVRKSSFGAFLYHVPDQALKALGVAMALAIAGLAKQPPMAIERFCNCTQIIVRFAHLEPKMQMVDIKTGLVGKLLTVKGHVVKARPKRLCVATAEFTCVKCGTSQIHKFDQGRYSFPTKCPNDTCKARSFSFVRPSVRYIDSQEIRLQEAQEENTVQAGRTPRQIEVELFHDLVDACRPGDIVLVAATVAAINTAVAAGQMGKRARETSTYKLYLSAHSITTMSESSNNNRRHDSNSNQITYTQQQLRNITQLCHADHKYFGMQERRAFPFDLLVRSICPSIIGHNEVKAGLLLCLLGGTPPSAQTKDKGNQIRCNSHILIVGDPGMGKSQMLLATTQLATRSVYVGGNTSSTTGLTVTLTKEERGETGIEAGALVLADQGVCAIDEFDKMAKNHQDGLLEAMEQQQVSIAKAGVVASLPARCSVLAAANPKHGSYNMSKTVAENLNMAKPILSRFDLVFILRDRANRDLDRLVSSNIMNLYRGSENTHDNTASDQATQESANGRQVRRGKQRMPIAERLAWVHGFQKQPLPADLVRDYIAYAREYCKPKLTPEAAEVLKHYFMELRYPSTGQRKSDTVPITTRQLEALIRLCQARAKACLRDFVLREDALDVVELMSLSVEQVHSDEQGLVDKGRGGAGGKSNRKMKKEFTKELHTVIGIGVECRMDDLRRIADRVGCGIAEFSGLVEDLREKGVLMKKSAGLFQVLQ